MTSLVATEPGDVWAWGAGDEGNLGLNAREHQLLPALMLQCVWRTQGHGDCRGLLLGGSH